MHSSAWRGAVDSSMGISSGTRMEQGGGGHLGGGAGAKRRVGWQEGRVEQAQGQADAGALSAQSTFPKRPRLEPSDNLKPPPPPGGDGSGVGGEVIMWSSGASHLPGRSEIMQCGDAQVCGCGCGVCWCTPNVRVRRVCVDDSHNLFRRRIDQTTTVRVTCQH